MKKICTKCEIEKDLNEFYRDKSKKDGRKSQCAECVSKKQKEYSYYKYNAKRRNLSFTISKKEFRCVMSQPCWYCGATDKIGLDRVNNKKGYIPYNVISCCSNCNFLRGNLTIDEFLERVRAIKV